MWRRGRTDSRLELRLQVMQLGGTMNRGRAPRVTPVVKSPPGSAGDTGNVGRIPGSGRCPGEGHGTATHSRILAWRTPWTEGPGGLQVHRVAESDRTERLNVNDE